MDFHHWLRVSALEINAAIGVVALGLCSGLICERIAKGCEDQGAKACDEDMGYLPTEGDEDPSLGLGEEWM